jgi:uncharacterized protein YkwD
MRKITILSMLLVMALFIVPSCAPKVSPQEYDRVSNELSTIQSQLASLQGKLAEAELLQAQNEELNKQYDTAKSELEAMQAKYEDLNAEYDGLNEQFDTVKSEFEAMQARYEDLDAEYEELNEQFEELSEQYNIIMEGAAGIDEEDIEQAVFKLVNQERENNGLDEIAWGGNLYKWAITNSRSMATNKRLEYSEYVGWQEIFWATGYGTAERIASAALAVWKNRQQYERNFLNTGANYGAVGVHKSGEVFYITYMADYFR